MVQLFERICPRCFKGELLCRPCRNQTRYCSAECSKQARRASWRRAGAKYRQTREKTHFARQRRYREKHATDKKAVSNVTHRSLAERLPSVSMMTRNADEQLLHVARLCVEVIVNAPVMDHDRTNPERSTTVAQRARSGPNDESTAAVTSAATGGTATARVIEPVVWPTSTRCARCGRRGYPAASRALGAARR